MSVFIQDQDVILGKLKIPQLNPMQEEAIPTIERVKNTILLSPTGTGKTLAFLLPIIKNLNIDSKEVQAL
ncbi:MAG: DEAD/DEAH box helicase, partial [Flavobacteriales bacterium]|nr:DEAD/DEAH box helicase [Flavobacteriales bacterium]